MLLVGYFEGLDSQRAIAWRCHDSRSLQSFLGYSITDPTPDHSSLTLIRQRLALEIHEQVFTKVLQSAQEKKLLKGKAVAVDSTLIEAEAAMEALCQPLAVASISIVPIDDTTDPPSVEGIVTVEALIEVCACLSSASFLVDDEIVGDMTDQGDGSYSFVWDTRQWSPGNHFIAVASTRSCGSGSTLELLVQVANQVANGLPGRSVKGPTAIDTP